MIDKERVSRRFGRAAASYQREAVAQQQIANRLSTLIERCGVSPGGRVLEIGCGTGLLTRCVDGLLNPQQYILNDISQEMLNTIEGRAGYEFICGDAEELVCDGVFDLIASSSTMQWFTSPRDFVRKMEGLLAPGATLALSTFGCDNLCEITSLTRPSSLSYLSVEECASMLTSQMELVECFDERITLRFETPYDALLHLKYSGVNGIVAEPLTPSEIRAALREYESRYAHPDGGVTLTYHPIYLIAKRV